MQVSQLKISELDKLTEKGKVYISRYFKNMPDNQVTRTNGRVTGISNNAVAQFLDDCGLNKYTKGGVILAANLCGGVGKTSGTLSLSACCRRLTSSESAIVLVDTDSQGSLTTSLFGKPANDNEPILIDFLEGKAGIDNILTPLGNNTWVVKSNLNQAYIDKVLSKPVDIKQKMLKFYTQVFKKLGKQTKIFQDHTPQLSSIFASSVCALPQLNEDIIKSTIVPMRSDNYAIDGAEKIIIEMEELQETFNMPQSIDVHCYFSSIDRRISTTSQAIMASQSKKRIIENLSPIVVRYCAEIPKSIQSAQNIYSSGKTNKATEDYQELLQTIFSKSEGV